MTERRLAMDSSETCDDGNQEFSAKIHSKGPTSILRKKSNKYDVSPDCQLVSPNKIDRAPSPKKEGRVHSNKITVEVSRSGELDNTQLQDDVRYNKEKTRLGTTTRTTSLSPKKQRNTGTNKTDSYTNKDTEGCNVNRDIKRNESMHRRSPKKEGRVTVLRSSSDGHALMNQMRDAIQFVVNDSDDEEIIARPNVVKKQAKRTEQDVASNPRISRSRSHCAVNKGSVVGIDVNEKSRRLVRSTTICPTTPKSMDKKTPEQMHNNAGDSESDDEDVNSSTIQNDVPTHRNTKMIKPPTTPGRQRLRTKIALKDLVKEDGGLTEFDDTMKTPQTPGAIARFLQARAATTPKGSSSTVVSGMTTKVIKALPIAVTPKSTRSKVTKNKKDGGLPPMDSCDDGSSETAVDEDHRLVGCSSPSRRTKHSLRSSIQGKVQDEKQDTKTNLTSPLQRHSNVVSTGLTSPDAATSPRHKISDDEFLALFNRPRIHDVDSTVDNTSNATDDVSPRRRRYAAVDMKANFDCTPSRKVGTATPSAQRNAMKQLQMNVEHAVPMLLVASTTPHKKSATGTNKKKVDSFAWSTGYSPAM